MNNLRIDQNVCQNGQRAFSLVELLAALAIVSILSVLIVPVVGHIRAKASCVECLSNMRQIAVGMNLYANDHNDRYPSCYPDGGATWRMKLLPYVNMPEDSIGLSPLPLEAGIFVCPSFEKESLDSRQASYVINGQMRPEYRLDWDYRRSAVDPVTTFLLLEYDQHTSQFLYAWGDEDVARRHPNNSANYAFVDGHVENIQEFVPRGDKRWFYSN